MSTTPTRLMTFEAFQQIPEPPGGRYELFHGGWRADVAFIYMERWERLDPDGDFLGAPDLVVEIRSPANTQRWIEDRERICSENGAREFWLVDTRSRTVRVAAAAGRVTYTCGQSIPLFFGGNLLANEIFQ